MKTPIHSISAGRTSIKKDRRGFTLIEILIVIGMIAILASVVLVAINPLRQFAQARNSQRVSNVNAILNAVGGRIADNRGLFVNGTDTTCAAIPSAATEIGKSGYDIRPCLVPTYISELPFDPVQGNNTCTNDTCSSGGYDTFYTIASDTRGRITVCAPKAGQESSLPDSRAYCLTR